MRYKQNFVKFICIVFSYLLISCFVLLNEADADENFTLTYTTFYELHNQRAKINISKEAIQTYGIRELVFEDTILDINDPTIIIEENGVYTLTITYEMDNKVTKATQEIQITEIQKQISTRAATGIDLVPDINFYNYLVFEKGLDSNFTIEDLGQVDSIYYIENNPTKRIRDLQGIEYMTSLRYIYLNDHNIKSLEPMRNTVYPYLSQMEFNNWNTGTNEIHDFSILTASRFPNLDEQIMFNNNGIDDDDLNTLPITDCIPEVVFHFQNNNITDISIFEHYTDAKRLILNHNNITDITPLSNLTKINILQLSNNNITDISPLATITTNGNAAIWLNNNHVTDLSALANVSAVVYVRHNSDADPYQDPNNNQGQRYTNETSLIGDKATGKVIVTSIVKDRYGNTIPMTIDGQTYESIELTLDPTADDVYQYSLNYFGDDTWYVGEVTQPIIWWEEPSFTANDIELYVGDTYDLMKDVKAYDILGNDITSDVEVASTNINNKKAGTYQVTYSIEDTEGYSATYQRKIKVHGQPVILAKPQKYELGNTNIDYSIRNRVDAYWLKAQDTIGAEPIKQAIDYDDIHYALKNGNAEFNAIGIYDVNYEAINKDGKKGTKTIQVLITNRNSVMDSLSNLVIGADNLQFTYDEVQSLTKSQAISKSNVRSFLMKRTTDGQISGFADVGSSIGIHEEQWQQIKNVSSQGGVFELLYTIKANNYEVSKKVTVTVYGNNTYPIGPNEEMIISGRNIHLTYDEAKALQAEDAIGEAEIKIYHKLDEKSNDNIIKVNEKQLKKINEVNIEGGVFKLTFSAIAQDYSGNSIEGELSVEVVVDAKNAMSIAGGKSKSMQSENETLSKAVVSAGDRHGERIEFNLFLLSLSGCLLCKFWKKRNLEGLQ
ncbi:hypothetical protein M2475_001536 [Breznakia sp. PF5-3]|uniref:immunoglobulin-like domain-containing protein n=1 Tax=unclassified Breznakia TaxID=2623764 RepID=UPI00240720CC|nr:MULTISPECIES: immunoglobulin-like domain-containing protein [unclassified Breznakia]MDF9825115.1 hypothetical protein [Breznakia sp. PM6-1]MDF9835962.1 hypothetical protein [Breznakia sp. PF5-3]